MFVRMAMVVISACVIVVTFLEQINMAVKVNKTIRMNCLSQIWSLCPVDYNECSNSNGGCQHNCTNIIGSYYCLCAAGYSLDDNGHSCSCKIKIHHSNS